MRLRLFLTAFVALAAFAASAQTVAPSSSNPATTPSVTQSVTVTADRGLAGINDSATSVAVLSAVQIADRSGFTLDDALRVVAGFQLFRRTSSWSANPTSQGVSLRGLGSTAASRTLVVSDEVPLNDPFGGWVHWNEVPLLAIDHAELLRGGAADLYGSSAIGGVIDLVPVAPLAAKPLRFDLDAMGASEDTAQTDALLTGTLLRTEGLGALSTLTTAGYTPTAPAFRGAVDTPANVTAESARTEFRRTFAGTTQAFLRGNVLNESRDNGTPLQTNATRLWRYQAGADAAPDTRTTALARAYGSRESYRQGFSAIAADRNSETLTRLQRVPTDEFGFVLSAARSLPAGITSALGIDLHDIRATDDETAVALNVDGVTTSTSARQRETGGYADAIWQQRFVSLSGSVRVDSFRTFDAQKHTSAAPANITPLPELDELMASPRFGLVLRPPQLHGLALTGTAFRAFRGPTMNELYRTGQVGSQTTLANASLLAERATGFEFGGEYMRDRIGALRASYFWTEVNRPVSAVLLSQTGTMQTLQRQNLGQIRSRGLMLETQSQPWHSVSASFDYQLAIATVTRYNTSSPVQQDLVGKWIPQVARHAFTGALHYESPRIATLIVSAQLNGRQFDDAANQYLLHSFVRFDTYAERRLTRKVSMNFTTQNLLNCSIDAGRTPVLTLAAPRIVEGGIKLSLSR